VSLHVPAEPRDDLPPDLLELLPEADGLAWLHRGDGWVGWGEAARVEAGTGEERFQHTASALADLFDGPPPDAGSPAPLALASFTFDPRSTGSFARIPARVVVRRHGRGWLLDADRGSPPPTATPLPHAATADRVRYAGSSKPDLQWLEAVATATRRIESGDVEKVVLARDHAVWSRVPFDSRVLARRLAARFPECYTFVAEGLVGASPELLVRRAGNVVESLVLAGSAARGPDDAGDRALGKALRGSDKERAEHELAVASVRDVLDRLCHDLQADAEPFLLRLDNVQHLATRLRGTLPKPAPTALELAGALHPTAAVCGTPTAVALDLVRELEGMDRGRYTGPVGWVDARGDGEFAIALRCAEISGARARLFAGAGIVAGSLPEAELEETRLKLRAMQSALGSD
jgi:menaquinone-specific isochorismate synthase